MALVESVSVRPDQQVEENPQVDASILITANVPSAKKIIVHGPTEPDEGAIPSQFPISEDIQVGKAILADDNSKIVTVLQSCIHAHSFFYTNDYIF